MLKIKNILLLFVLFFALSGCEKITDKVISPPAPSEPEPLTVMTYNVYIGADVLPLLGITNLLEVPKLVGEIYQKAIASDFPARAKGIAKSIKTHQPHLIGLQEISLLRTQTPGDRIAGGEVPAEEIVLNFLDILMDALQAEGLNYQVAVQVENIDVEMPMFTDADGIVDVRLTDYDVILARSDVEIANPMSANYANALTIDMLGLAVKRGYAAVDATVSGTTYRVVNTHLEAFEESSTMATARVGQTEELVESLRDETLPIILLGDFNTVAYEGTGYQLLTSAGYLDVWDLGLLEISHCCQAAGDPACDDCASENAKANKINSKLIAMREGNMAGNTCCQDEDLLNEVSNLSVRIDQIFVRNMDLSSNIILSFTVGDKPSDRLPSGMWPSDHAGVVAVFDSSSTQ